MGLGRSTLEGVVRTTVGATVARISSPLGYFVAELEVARREGPSGRSEMQFDRPLLISRV